MRNLWLLLAPFLLLLAVAGACGDDGNSTEPSATVVLPVETVPVFNEETPTSFGALRGELQDRLDGIGVNIGGVPDDVRQELLEFCIQLENFADGGEVAEICDLLEDAIEQGDPEILDTVLDRLAGLQAA